MEKRYFKATRPDGKDFHSGTIDYAAALASGEVVRHPRADGWDDAGQYLSVATVATDCTGFAWPCRLFAVEAVGRARTVDSYKNKRAVHALSVVEELRAWQVFGPQGREVAAVIERARALTGDEIERLAAARAAAWSAARAAAWSAAWDAALAYLVRDLITPEQFHTLAGPWLSVVGEVTP